MSEEKKDEIVISAEDLEGFLDEAKGESVETEVETEKEKEGEVEIELEPEKQEEVEVESEKESDEVELELEVEPEVEQSIDLVGVDEIEKQQKERKIMLGQDTPNTMVQDIQTKADILYSVVEKQHLYQEIRGKKYLQLEAWQTLGKFCNVVGKIEWVRPVELWDAKGFEAKGIIQEIEITTDKEGKIYKKLGNVIASVESMCMNDETNWKNKPMFQLKSMAQTRVLSKAYRSCLSFIVALAGYAPTPLEEIE